MRAWGSTLAFLCVACAVSVAVLANDPLWGDLKPGPHDVGFRLVEEIDASRAIRVTGATPAVRSRPIRVYIWYPAEPSTDAVPMRFGRYATLATEDVWPSSILGEARERMAYRRRPLAMSLGEEAFGELLDRPVRAVEHATASAGSFPLIVVGQGLYYESPVTHAILCEFLASHGFVVATAPLVGTNSPMVNLDVLDLETQVRDMEFVIAHARRMPSVSPHDLGILGFDMGGIAGAILTMRNPDVDGFVSMDAAILYNDALDIPADSPHYDPAQLRAPWLHITQRPFAERPEGYDGPFLFDTALYSDRYLALLDGMGHADFTSYALIDDRSPRMGYWPPPSEHAKKRYETVCLYISRFFKAYLSNDAGSRGFLVRDPDDAVLETTLTIEHRRASPSPPDESGFLNALLAGDVSGAIEMARGFSTFRSEGKLSQEVVLIRLGSRLFYTWQLAAEAIAVLELNAELHASSARSQYALAEIYYFTGDHERALRGFRKVLELDPSIDSARRAVESLESEEDK